MLVSHTTLLEISYRGSFILLVPACVRELTLWLSGYIMSRVSFFMRVDPENFAKRGLMDLPKEAIGPERRPYQETYVYLGFFRGLVRTPSPPSGSAH